jgi:hypothetical protein
MLKTWAIHTHAIRRAGDLATEDTEKGQGSRYLDVRLSLCDLCVLCGKDFLVSDA